MRASNKGSDLIKKILNTPTKDFLKKTFTLNEQLKIRMYILQKLLKPSIFCKNILDKNTQNSIKKRVKYFMASGVLQKFTSNLTALFLLYKQLISTGWKKAQDMQYALGNFGVQVITMLTDQKGKHLSIDTKKLAQALAKKFQLREPQKKDILTIGQERMTNSMQEMVQKTAKTTPFSSPAASLLCQELVPFTYGRACLQAIYDFQRSPHGHGQIFKNQIPFVNNYIQIAHQYREHFFKSYLGVTLHLKIKQALGKLLNVKNFQHCLVKK